MGSLSLLPDSGIKPQSLALEADSLPAEPAGKPPVLLLLRCQSGVRDFEKPGSQVVLFTSELPVWTPGASRVCPPGSCMHSMSGIGEQTISAVIQLLHETGGIFQETRDLATYFQL